MKYQKQQMRRLRSKLYGNFDCDTDIIALHDSKVLFFSLPKVANTSVKRVLQGVIPEMEKYLHYAEYQSENGSLFAMDEVRNYLIKHKVLLCKHDVKRYQDYNKIAFVRSPYDRLVSCYTQKVLPFQGIENPNSRGTLRALIKAGVYQEAMTFLDFAKAVSVIPDTHANRHFRSQSSFLTGKDKSLLIEDYYYFEDLTTGINQLQKLIGRDDIELPHSKRTKRDSYEVYYTQEAYELVYKRYYDDFKLFGYMK